MIAGKPRKEENMESNTFEVKVLRKVSKAGNTYVCLEITFPNGYKKIAFVDSAEEYMLQSYIE